MTEKFMYPVPCIISTIFILCFEPLVKGSLVLEANWTSQAFPNSSEWRDVITESHNRIVRQLLKPIEFQCNFNAISMSFRL